MKIQSVKGTRDFYPDAMRLRNWICDNWRKVSLRNGFEEYDSPIFEYLDLFTIKSGDEIASQLFNFTDRGGRSLAIRPEITPSLARMVNAQINSLPRPIKWFSIPRLCRAENPQKGRLREFFQWNIDVIGSDDVLADAECLLVAVDFLREIGLDSDDVKIQIGSRPLTMAVLKAIGVKDGSYEKVLAVLDKRPKIGEEEFARLCKTAGIDDEQRDAICNFQDVENIDALKSFGDKYFSDCEKQLEDMGNLWQRLDKFGVADYCVLDMRIVRGLAYYTGIVYEIFDAKQSLRAVGGGGRYDNLLQVLGGPKVGATGFGMGDVVLGILLEEKGKISSEILSGSLDYFVIDGEDGLFSKVMELVSQLRARQISAEFSYKRQNIGKQLKEANRRGAKSALIVRDNEVAIKNLSTGEQAEKSLDDFLKSL